MRLYAIFRESCLNNRTGSSFMAPFMWAFTLLMCGLCALDLWQVRALSLAAKQYQEAGASTYFIETQSRIDGAACDALSRVQGVQAAGALREAAAPLKPLSLPSGEIPVFSVTVGFPEIFGAKTNQPGAVVSAEVAQVLSLKVGSEIKTERGALQVADIYQNPEDGRKNGYGYAVLAPEPTAKKYDQCWVRMWPESEETVKLLYLTVLPGADSREVDVRVSQFNSSLGAEFDEQSFYSRATSWYPVLGLMISALMGFFYVWLRRLQFASMLHAGAQKTALTLIAGLEVSMWILPAVAAGVLCSLVFAAAAVDAPETVYLLLGSRIIVSAVAGFYAGVLAAVAVIKEKQLFKLFKDR